MLRFLSITALCLLAAGCLGSSSDNDSSSNNVGGTTVDNGLSPPTLVESPPTNGVLPADLKPPV